MFGELSKRQMAIIIALVAAVLAYFGTLYVVDHWIAPRDPNDPLVKQHGLKLEQAPA
jgi:hypothetical protein